MLDKILKAVHDNLENWNTPENLALCLSCIDIGNNNICTKHLHLIVGTIARPCQRHTIFGYIFNLSKTHSSSFSDLDRMYHEFSPLILK